MANLIHSYNYATVMEFNAMYTQEILAGINTVGCADLHTPISAWGSRVLLVHHVKHIRSSIM